MISSNIKSIMLSSYNQIVIKVKMEVKGNKNNYRISSRREKNVIDF